MTASIETFFFESILLASRDAAVLAIAISVVLFVFGKRIPAFWKHCLWLLVALRLVIPVLPDSPFSWKNWTVQETKTLPALEAYVPSGQPQNTQPHRYESAESRGLSQAPNPVVSPTQPSLVSGKNWGAMAAWGWFLIASALLTFSLLRGFLFHQKIRRFTSTKSNDHLSALLDEVASERSAQFTNCAETIRVTDAVTSPALTGIFRPEILLPSGLVGEISDRDLCHILRHELAHHRRRDVWTNWLLTILQAVHWFNPLVWWAFHRTRIEAERATDASVLRDIGESERVSYGDALIHLLERISTTEQKQKSRVPGVVGVAESHRGLRERISLIGSFSGRRRWVVSGFSAFMVLGVAAMGLTDPESVEKEKTSKERSVAKTETEWEIEVHDAAGSLVPVEKLGKFAIQKKGEKRMTQISGNEIMVLKSASDQTTRQYFHRNLPDAEPGAEVSAVVVPLENRPALFAEGVFSSKGSRKLVLRSGDDLQDAEFQVMDSMPGFVPEDLAGRVVDADGLPVSGAKVSARWQWTFRDTVQETGEDGYFRLVNFFKDSKWPGIGIKVEKEGLGVSWVVDIPVGKPFAVTLGQTNSRIQGICEGGGAGTIQFFKNKASRFERIGHTAHQLQHESLIAEDGSFDVAIEPGLYDIRIRTGSGMFAQPEKVRLGSNQSKVIHPKLLPGAELHVEATDIETGLPISGVSFYFEEKTPSHTGVREGSKRQTDENGVAKWEGLPIGENVFNLQRGEWMRMTSSDGLVFWPRDRSRSWHQGLNQFHLDLKSGQNQISVKLERGVAVKGIVLKPDGKPLEQSWIHLSDSHGSTMTGDDRFGMWSSFGNGKPTSTSRFGPKKVFPKGYFQGWIPAGRGLMEFGLTARDFRGRNNDQRTAVEQNERWAEAISDLFTCKPGDELEFTLQLSKGGQAIGRVIAEAGKPIPNIEVQARNQDRRSSSYANPVVLTNEKGEFRFDVLRKGKYIFYPDTKWGTNLGDGIIASQRNVFTISEGKETSVGDLVFAGVAPELEHGKVRIKGEAIPAPADLIPITVASDEEVEVKLIAVVPWPTDLYHDEKKNAEWRQDAPNPGIVILQEVRALDRKQKIESVRFGGNSLDISGLPNFESSGGTIMPAVPEKLMETVLSERLSDYEMREKSGSYRPKYSSRFVIFQTKTAKDFPEVGAANLNLGFEINPKENSKSQGPFSFRFDLAQLPFVLPRVSSVSIKPEIRLARVVEEGSADAAKAKRMSFAGSADKESVLVDPESIISEDDIESAALLEGRRNNSGISIMVEIRESGHDRLQRATESLIGKRIAIIVEGKLISAPVVREPFSNGFQITGNFSREDAERIVAAFRGEEE